MANENIGPVKVRVELDTSEAEREAKFWQDKLKKQDEKLQSTNRRVRDIKLGERNSGTAGTRGFQGAGARTGTHRGGVANEIERFVRKNMLARGDVGGISKFSGMMNKSAGGIGRAAAMFGAGRIGGKLAAAAGPIGVGAAVYGAASATSKILPMELDFVQAATGADLGPINTAVEELRQAFVRLESVVMGSVEAGKKTLTFMGEGARISGRAPTWSAIGDYFHQNFINETAERELESKFNRFKNKQIVTAWGDMMGKTLNLKPGE